MNCELKEGRFASLRHRSRFSFVMLKTDPLTRSRALDLLAGRLRDQFEDRLRALYVLPDNPYEPAGDDEWIILAAVLDEEFCEENDASRLASEVGSGFEHDIDWQYVVTVFTLPDIEMKESKTEIARLAQSGGVRL